MFLGTSEIFFVNLLQLDNGALIDQENKSHSLQSHFLFLI